jgi:hypothetical protein
VLQAEKKTIVQKNLFDNKAIPRAPDGLSTKTQSDDAPKASLFDYHKSVKGNEGQFVPVKF